MTIPNQVLRMFLFLFLLYLLADTSKNASGKMACVYKMTYSVVFIEYIKAKRTP